jgi:hypothetical protein
MARIVETRTHEWSEPLFGRQFRVLEIGHPELAEKLRLVMAERQV